MVPRILALVASLASTPAAADTLVASWYGPGFHGRATASGCVYDMAALSAASRDLALGTLIEVSRGGRTVRLVVNDRGPYVAHRQLDLSRAAAERLGMIGLGVARVDVRVVGFSPPRCRLRGPAGRTG